MVERVCDPLPACWHQRAKLGWTASLVSSSFHFAPSRSCGVRFTLSACVYALLRWQEQESHFPLPLAGRDSLHDCGKQDQGREGVEHRADRAGRSMCRGLSTCEGISTCIESRRRGTPLFVVAGVSPSI